MRIYRYYYDYECSSFRYDEYSSIEEIIDKFAFSSLYFGGGYLTISIDKVLYVSIQFIRYSYLHENCSKHKNFEDYFKSCYPNGYKKGFMQFIGKGSHYVSNDFEKYDYYNKDKGLLKTKVKSCIVDFINGIKFGDIKCQDGSYKSLVSRFKCYYEEDLTDDYNPGDYTNIYGAEYYVSYWGGGDYLVGYDLYYYNITVYIKCNDYLRYFNSDENCCSCNNICYLIRGLNFGDGIIDSINI